jgi:hypothetical protein
MPRIDIRCLPTDPADDQHEPHEHEVYRALADWPNTPPCPTCGAPTEQWHPPPRTRWTVDPVVVFKAPDGSYRFPGDPNGLQAAKYARDGFDRVELRSAADVRRFEREVNQQDRSQSSRRAETLQASREARERMLRPELRRLMPNFSRFGRDVARAAMARNDAKPREYSRDSNFHVDAYSNDRTNREAARDERGRRRRD